MTGKNRVKFPVRLYWQRQPRGLALQAPGRFEISVGFGWFNVMWGAHSGAPTHFCWWWCVTLQRPSNWAWGREESWYDGPITNFGVGPINFNWRKL